MNNEDMSKSVPSKLKVEGGSGEVEDAPPIYENISADYERKITALAILMGRTLEDAPPIYENISSDYDSKITALAQPMERTLEDAPPSYENISSDYGRKITALAQSMGRTLKDAPPSYENISTDYGRKITALAILMGRTLEDAPPIYENISADYERKITALAILMGRTLEELDSVDSGIPRKGIIDHLWNKNSHQVDRNISHRLTAVELSVTESKHVASETHQLLQTMSQGMERLEVKQSQSELSEERLSQRVVEQLVQRTHSQSMLQTRDVSMNRTKSADEQKESLPGWHKCIRCNCKKRCPCSCHFHDNNWQLDRRPDRTSDQNQPFDSKNDTHDVSDFESQTPNNGQREEYGRDMSFLEEEASNDEFHEVYGACRGDPGGPPSDDSSSDDNSDNGRENKVDKGVKDKRNKKLTWITDAAEWQTRLDADCNFEQKAKSLLKQRKLPDQGVLNAVCAKFSLSSPVVIEICKYICSYLKEISERIVYVWAAKTIRKDHMTFENEIVFVVLTSGTDSVDIKDFVTCQRCVTEIKTIKENFEINEKELQHENRPSLEEIQDLEKCLRENAKILMEKHSKLTKVTAGWFRRRINETGQYFVQREMCIVLYVHVKGFAPLNEELFPTKIGKYPVDVREGIFTLCAGPDDYHKHVRMGCGIVGERQGTLGAFVEVEKDRRVYGITCAHVVFGDEKFKLILKRENLQTSFEIVKQPASNPLGKTVAVLYEEGGNGVPGMEIALIEINEDRLPSDGHFPEDDSGYSGAGFGIHKPFVFCSGKAWDPKQSLRSNSVYKYGCKTKFTQGKCFIYGASVRTMDFKHNMPGSELVLHDQIEVQSSSSSCPFAEQGDSGALVVTNDNNSGELTAFGIIEGHMGDKISVTPIYAVLNELTQHFGQPCNLKTFPQFHFQNEVLQSGEILYKKVSLIDENVNNLQGTMNSIGQCLEADKREQKMQTSEIKEQRKQTQEIKDQTEQILRLLQGQKPL